MGIVILNKNSAATPKGIRWAPKYAMAAMSKDMVDTFTMPYRAARIPPAAFPRTTASTAASPPSMEVFHEKVTVMPRYERRSTTSRQHSGRMPAIFGCCGLSAMLVWAAAVCGLLFACLKAAAQHASIKIQTAHSQYFAIPFLAASVPRYRPSAPGATKMPSPLPHQCCSLSS